MKEFWKITNTADVLDSQHFLQLNKIFLMHQNDNNQTDVCSYAASYSAPTKPYFNGERGHY